MLNYSPKGLYQFERRVFLPLQSLEFLVFFRFNFYLNLFLSASGLSCGMQDLSLGHAGFSLVVACGFFSLSSYAQAPESVGSVVCRTQAL